MVWRGVLDVSDVDLGDVVVDVHDGDRSRRGEGVVDVGSDGEWSDPFLSLHFGSSTLRVWARAEQDAVASLEACERSGDGVVVRCDLGSALLSERVNLEAALGDVLGVGVVWGWVWGGGADWIASYEKRGRDVVDTAGVVMIEAVDYFFDVAGEFGEREGGVVVEEA